MAGFNLLLLDSEAAPDQTRRLLLQRPVGIVLSGEPWAARSGIAGASRQTLDWNGTSGGQLVVTTMEDNEGLDQSSPLPVWPSQPYSDGGSRIGFQTSGTTGDPKIGIHDERGLLASVDTVQNAFRSTLGLTRQQIGMGVRLFVNRPKAVIAGAVGRRIWMTPLPVWRISGHTLMLQALLSGGTFVAPNDQRSSELVRIARAERATVLATTPVTCEFIVRYTERSPVRFPNLLVIGIGSDRVPQSLVRRTREAIGCCVVAGYGSTELAGGISTTHPLHSGEHDDGCVGKPFPGIALRIVDDLGDEVPIRTVGHVLCSMPVERRPSGQTRSTTDWHRTGDMGWLDNSGQLHITGRSDDLIVKGGTKIDPVPIEAVLSSHPGIAAARRSRRPIQVWFYASSSRRG